MIGIRRLGHVALTVVDLDASLAFYRDALGLVLSDREVIRLADGRIVEGAWLRCDNDHHCLALFTVPRDGLDSPPDPSLASAGPGAPGLNHFAFEFATYEELKSAHDALKDRGIGIDAVRVYGPGSQIRFYCLDPDGNKVEFYWALDQIGWDGRTRTPRTIEDVDLDTFDVAEFLAYKSELSASPTAID